MRMAELRKRPVVDLSSARRVARVADVAVDPATGRVVGLRLAKSEGGDWVDWSGVHGVGADAVTVSSLAALRSAGDAEKEALARTAKALKRRVLSDRGVELGTLRDLELDESTGVVAGVVLDDGRSLPGEALLGMGRYATVVAVGS